MRHEYKIRFKIDASFVLKAKFGICCASLCLTVEFYLNVFIPGEKSCYNTSLNAKRTLNCYTATYELDAWHAEFGRILRR